MINITFQFKRECFLLLSTLARTVTSFPFFFFFPALKKRKKLLAIYIGYWETRFWTCLKSRVLETWKVIQCVSIRTPFELSLLERVREMEQSDSATKEHLKSIITKEF